MILTDNETRVDLLNNEAIASTIVGLPEWEEIETRFHHEPKGGGEAG